MSECSEFGFGSGTLVRCEQEARPTALWEHMACPIVPHVPRTDQGFVRVFPVHNAERSLSALEDPNTFWCVPQREAV
jgi:hypothetical protein